MSTILVTGGTGMLGSALVRAARKAGHTVRIMSRRPRPDALTADHEWAQADLSTGEGLSLALEGVDVVLHAATASGFGNFKDVDVAGTRRLLEATSRAPVRHFLYPSIVGVDAIPLGYYVAKRRIEEDVLGSGVPSTVVRATQFHAFVLRFIRLLGKSPVMGIPAGFRIQSVFVNEYADHLMERMEGEPEGMAPDFAGPEVMELSVMARIWTRIAKKRRLVLALPLIGKTARAFRDGHATNPDRAVGRVGWEEWLRRVPM